MKGKDALRLGNLLLAVLVYIAIMMSLFFITIEQVPIVIFSVIGTVIFLALANLYKWYLDRL